MSFRKTENSTEDGRLREKRIARWKNTAKKIPAPSASRGPFTQTRQGCLDGWNSGYLKATKRFGWKYSITYQVDLAREPHFRAEHRATAPPPLARLRPGAVRSHE